MLKRIKGLILIIIMAVLTTACSNQGGQEDRSQELLERGYIIMGMDDTFAPMGFRDKDGQLVGFDLDLARELSEKLDLEIRFQPIDWSMKEAELKTGKIDLIWNGYSITEKRRQDLNFSQVYLDNSQIIVVMKEKDIETKEDLRGRKLALQNGSSSLEAVNKEPELVAELDGGEPVLFDTNHEAFLDLESGRSDALVSDEVLARYYMAEKGADNYKVLEEDFGKEEYGIGIRKGDKKLLELINQGLDSMRQDGSYDRIYKKWFE